MFTFCFVTSVVFEKEDVRPQSYKWRQVTLQFAFLTVEPRKVTRQVSWPQAGKAHRQKLHFNGFKVLVAPAGIFKKRLVYTCGVMCST